jgi:hypothetical protein
MHCAKCNFQLIKSVLNMHSGTVTAGDSNPELCPNGCGPLWRVSWEKYANDHYEDGVKTFEKLRATEAELEAARKQEPAVLIEGKKIFWNPEYKGVHDGGFYASPVPAQQPEISGDIPDFTEEELLRLTNLLQQRELVRVPAQHSAEGADIHVGTISKVPPEHPLRDSMSSLHRSYAEGWNKCRAAMISGELPVWAKQSLRTNNGNLS